MILCASLVSTVLVDVFISSGELPGRAKAEGPDHSGPPAEGWIVGTTALPIGIGTCFYSKVLYLIALGFLLFSTPALVPVTANFPEESTKIGASKGVEGVDKSGATHHKLIKANGCIYARGLYESTRSFQ